MKTCAKRLRVPAISLLLAALVLLPSHVIVQAGNPHGAQYSSDSSRIFWFLHASDLHVGMSGSTDTTRLQWLVTTAKAVINPAFIVVTGDLTDSTNGNWLGVPNGPYQAEWDQYKSILSGRVDSSSYYDLPGNHDAYSDATFAYYRANSVQGRATGGTQVSWTRTFPFGTYHFIGVNSAGNDGRAFSIGFPYGDNAGLDSTELAFINQALSANSGAALTFAFGHHPVTDTGESGDTWLFYGHREFIQALDTRGASTYNYGHTHRTSQALFAGNTYTGLMGGDGLYYYNVASLSKDSGTGYSLVAVDSNGVSSIANAVNAWPLVLITSPLDRYIGSAVNPYAYSVPASSTNFVRALVFDAGTISQVRFRIDGGATWYSMNRIAGGSPVWQGAWDASALAAGNHTIEVQATGTTTVTDSITVEVMSAGNSAPVAANDVYTVEGGKTLTVGAPGVLGNDTDADNDALTAARVGGPSHGSLTLNAAGSFVYTPAAGYVGADSFTYSASDGLLLSTATASITVTAPSQADTVTIVSATYNTRRKQLSVTATSTVQPNATLTVVGYGLMTYKPKTRTYVLTTSAPTKPASVTVTSTGGGTGTKSVS